ncbi:MAG: transglutaminase-like domain-containing protein [Eubacteriales bacterium]|nr:transglutaminase-like domain-containing protein [Eubacteriales bacterium]
MKEDLSQREDFVNREKYLKATPMLDYQSESIQALVEQRGWKNLDDFHKIGSIYNFVRDEIAFGYNVSDKISAAQVLRDGYGQCNTKGTLFMALLRAVGICCRVHGFTIDKKLQKGAMTGIVYRNAPNNVFHSWVEVLYQGKWYELEAFILDKEYLEKLQKQNSSCTGAFCGYGVAVSDFQNPQIDWNANNTYIQSEGINQDFGVYNSPDELLKEHHQEMSGFKEFLYKNLGRHLMNRNVKKIRNGGKSCRISEQ